MFTIGTVGGSICKVQRYGDNLSTCIYSTADKSLLCHIPLLLTCYWHILVDAFDISECSAWRLTWMWPLRCVLLGFSNFYIVKVMRLIVEETTRCVCYATTAFTTRAKVYNNAYWGQKILSVQWVNQRHSFPPAKCGPAPFPPKSEVMWHNRSIVIHRCVDGYHSWRGSHISVCGSSGVWQTATLRCRGE